MKDLILWLYEYNHSVNSANEVYFGLNDNGTCLLLYCTNSKVKKQFRSVKSLKKYLKKEIREL